MDIPKTKDTYWKHSTVGEIMYGDISVNKAKVKLYRNNNDDYVRVHNIENNHEYIYVVDEKGLVNSGIFRYKNSIMDTSMGLNYISIADGKEERQFCLYRFKKSGQIIYLARPNLEKRGQRLEITNKV